MKNHWLDKTASKLEIKELEKLLLEMHSNIMARINKELDDWLAEVFPADIPSNYNI